MSVGCLDNMNGKLLSVFTCFFYLSIFLLFKCFQIFMDLNSASTVVLQVLTQATSQDTAVLKPAEEQLKQWETQPGFYSVLLVRYSGKVLLSKPGIILSAVL